MVQAVSHRPLNSEPSIGNQVRLCATNTGGSGTAGSKSRLVTK